MWGEVVKYISFISLCLKYVRSATEQKERKKAQRKKQNGKAHVESETRQGNRETAGKKHNRHHRPQDSDLTQNSDLTHKQTANGRPPESAVAPETTQARPSKKSSDLVVIHKQHPVPDKN